jgi:ketosteroid isomerase-like protein
MTSQHQPVADAMERINRAWRAGAIDELRPLLHPDIAFAVPGFVATVQGRERFLAGFADFVANAKVHAFEKPETTASEVGDTGVVCVRFEMVYERGGARYRSTGRDLWVFQRAGDGWIAVWRTMLDLTDDPA